MDISIAEAREKVSEYNKLLASCKNPKIEKEKQKLQDDNLFSNITGRYLDVKEPGGTDLWKLRILISRIKGYLIKYIPPRLKYHKIDEIESWEIVSIFDKETPNTQKKIKTLLSGIFSLAVGRGYTKYNIVRDIATKVNTQGFKFIDPIDDQSKLFHGK